MVCPSDHHNTRALVLSLVALKRSSRNYKNTPHNKINTYHKSILQHEGAKFVRRYRASIYNNYRFYANKF